MTYYDNLSASVNSILHLYKTGVKRLFSAFIVYSLIMFIIGIVVMYAISHIIYFYLPDDYGFIEGDTKDLLINGLWYVANNLRFYDFFVVIALFFPALFLFREQQRGFSREQYRMADFFKDADGNSAGNLILLLISGGIVTILYHYLYGEIFWGGSHAPGLASLLEQNHSFGLSQYLFNAWITLFIPLSVLFIFHFLRKEIDTRKTFKFYLKPALVSLTLTYAIMAFQYVAFDEVRTLVIDLLAIPFSGSINIVPGIIILFFTVLVNSMFALALAGSITFPLYHAFHAKPPEKQRHHLDPAHRAPDEADNN